MSTEGKKVFFDSVAHDKGFHAQLNPTGWDMLTVDDILDYEVRHFVCSRNHWYAKRDTISCREIMFWVVP